MIGYRDKTIAWFQELLNFSAETRQEELSAINIGEAIKSLNEGKGGGDGGEGKDGEILGKEQELAGLGNHLE